MSAAVFEERIDPGRASSAALSLIVHLALLAVLVFGVRWQNRPAEDVVVELWDAPQPVPAPPMSRPEPPKPVEAPKPEPRVEAPPPPKPEPKMEKPEIAEKAPPPKPKPVPKAPPKPETKAPALKPRVDETQRRIQEELAREQASLAIERERDQIRDQLARESTAARGKTMADWAAKVRAKVRGNMVLPPDIRGNPEALFDVVQLPNGEVLSVKLKKSSGSAALDEAIERAILKSSPLPRPDNKEAPPRSFELKYRPLDPI